MQWTFAFNQVCLGKRLLYIFIDYSDGYQWWLYHWYKKVAMRVRFGSETLFQSIPCTKAFRLAFHAITSMIWVAIQALKHSEFLTLNNRNRLVTSDYILSPCSETLPRHRAIAINKVQAFTASQTDAKYQALISSLSKKNRFTKITFIDGTVMNSLAHLRMHSRVTMFDPLIKNGIETAADYNQRGADLRKATVVLTNDRQFLASNVWKKIYIYIRYINIKLAFKIDRYHCNRWITSKWYFCRTKFVLKELRILSLR